MKTLLLLFTFMGFPLAEAQEAGLSIVATEAWIAAFGESALENFGAEDFVISPGELLLDSRLQGPSSEGQQYALTVEETPQGWVASVGPVTIQLSGLRMDWSPRPTWGGPSRGHDLVVSYLGEISHGQYRGRGRVDINIGQNWVIVGNDFRNLFVSKGSEVVQRFRARWMLNVSAGATCSQFF